MTRSGVSTAPLFGDTHDDAFLLAVLNSTPVVEGVPTDELEDLDSSRVWMADFGGVGTEAELAYLRRARAVLQGVVRDALPVSALGPLLHGVSYVPSVGEEISWTLKVTPERRL